MSTAKCEWFHDEHPEMVFTSSTGYRDKKFFLECGAIKYEFTSPYRAKQKGWKNVSVWEARKAIRVDARWRSVKM